VAYHLRCPHCAHDLYCRDCDEPIDAEAHIPGQVGTRHVKVPFDPTRRNAWNRERGRILTVMKAYHPWKFLVARELCTLAQGSTPNQTCTRLGELHAQGLVERTGTRRLTETDTPADEWRLTSEGLRLFRRVIPVS
jgi:hypothetical protein